MSYRVVGGAMNRPFALPVFLVFSAALGIAACSSDADTPTDAAKTCSPSLQSTVGCPDTPTAEGSFATVQSKCGIANDDLDTSTPTLKDAAKSKACVSCDCRTAIYAYASIYHACTSAGEAGNAALAANLQQLAAACP